MTTRREFVVGTTMAAGIAAVPREWRTALVPADRIERIGLELYTVRAEMKLDVPATLARVAKVGYREVEFAGYFGNDPARLRALLDAELEQQRHQHARRHDEEKAEPDEQPAEVLPLAARLERLLAHGLENEAEVGRFERGEERLFQLRIANCELRIRARARHTF